MNLKDFKSIGLSAKQQGIVSLMVVGILVVLLSLVSIGFARLMNRETRQALDKQLGVQSYYAAESGVNDAIAYINKIKASGGDIANADIKTCADSRDKLNFNLSGEANPNSQYSCVLIDTNPYAIEYDIKAGQSKVFSFDQERLTSLLISWQNSQGTDNYRPNATLPKSGLANGSFTSTGSWNATGALRVSIYPIMINPTVPAFPTPTRASWLDDRALTAKYSRTFFLYPDKAANATSPLIPVDYYDNNGAIITGQCDDKHTTIKDAGFPGPDGSHVYHCNSILNCFPDVFHGPDGSQSLNPNSGDKRPPYGCGGHGPGNEYRAIHYVVKITSLYADTNVMFRSAQSVDLIPVSLRGAQAVIDSTGKGNDVVRRISARVPLSANGNGEVGADLASPETALRTAESVCKRVRQLTTGDIMVDGGDTTTCSEGIP